MASSDRDRPQRPARSVERRTVLRVAAWTVPTVVVATASPAAATASGTMVAISATAERVENGPGQTALQRRVSFQVTFGGTSPGTHTVDVLGVTSSGGSWVLIGVNHSYSLGVGGGTITFQAQFNTDPGGENVTISFNISEHGTGTISATVPATIEEAARQPTPEESPSVESSKSDKSTESDATPSPDPSSTPHQ